MFFTAENNKRIVTEVKTDLSTQLPWTFELLDDHVLSQFLRGDVHKNGTRHLIFATDAQLEFLTNVKTWYVDATFKVIKQPFTQLFSIHTFLKKDGELMQTPLAFIVMLRRRRKDYKRVFRALIAALPSRPRIQAVLSDFEATVWSAAREVLPGVLQRGLTGTRSAHRLLRACSHLCKNM